MPITIKQNTFKYRNPDTGDYDGVDVLAETTVDELIADIEEVAEDQIDAIEAKGEEVIESIPSDYSELADQVDDLKTQLHAVLVEESSGSTLTPVTLTNKANTNDFYTDLSGRGGFERPTYGDGILTFVGGDGSESSPYALYTGAWGVKKWIVGLKYKITKIDSALADPTKARVHLGTTAYDNFSLAWDEWQDFAQVFDGDLTRIRIAIAFSSAPAANTFKLEIKDMYLYDATGVESDMCTYIMVQQSSNYQDGTVTYGEEPEPSGYYPDTSLAISGKCADSKAVGDAINTLTINVKDHGVKGDGTTDDTNAIRQLFAAKTGRFYFPAGTYKISGTIQIPENSIVYGDGNDTVINMYDCISLIAFTFLGNDKMYPYIALSGDNIKLHDIKLIGNNTLHTDRHEGVCVVDASNVTVSDVTVYNINYDPDRDDGDPDPVVSAYGISIFRSDKVAIERCYVEQCGYECIGVAYYATNCVVRDCVTKNGWRTCIQVHRGAKNVLIDNCYMTQTHQKYDACFTLHGQSGDDLVENLRVENCTAIMTATSITGQQHDYCAPFQLMSYCDGLWCVNNKCTGGKRALFASDSVTNLKIIGNQLDCNDSSDYGVKINSENAIVVGNTVTNAADTGNVIDASAVKSANIGIS